VEQFEKEQAEKRAEFFNQEFARKIQVQVVAEPSMRKSGKSPERE